MRVTALKEMPLNQSDSWEVVSHSLCGLVASSLEGGAELGISGVGTSSPYFVYRAAKVKAMTDG